MPSPNTNRRTHAERTTEPKYRLIEACITCLVDDGYAFTTTVSICARAGLTRGAYNHHDSDASSLYIDVFEWLYLNIGSDALKFADAMLCPDDEDFLDREQGIPHLKRIPCRISKFDGSPEAIVCVRKTTKNSAERFERQRSQCGSRCAPRGTPGSSTESAGAC